VHDNDDGSVFGFAGLPVTMPEQPRFGVHLEEPRFGGRDIEPPRHKGRNNGHDVAVFQKRVRLELKYGGHDLTEFTERGTWKRQTSPLQVRPCAKNSYH
jgi:hypothetical protein